MLHAHFIQSSLQLYSPKVSDNFKIVSLWQNRKWKFLLWWISCNNRWKLKELAVPWKMKSRSLSSWLEGLLQVSNCSLSTSIITYSVYSNYTDIWLSYHSILTDHLQKRGFITAVLVRQIYNNYVKHIYNFTY